jgi:hypothetical protein
MSILRDDDLAAEAERRASYRLHAVATKLSRKEAQAFAALAKERGRKRGDLLRQLILAEIARDSTEPTADVEFVEVIGIRLMLTNLLRPLMTGQRITPDVFDGILAEVKKRKRAVAVEARQESESAL